VMLPLFTVVELHAGRVINPAAIAKRPKNPSNFLLFVRGPSNPAITMKGNGIRKP